MAYGQIRSRRLAMLGSVARTTSANDSDNTTTQQSSTSSPSQTPPPTTSKSTAPSRTKITVTPAATPAQPDPNKQLSSQSAPVTGAQPGSTGRVVPFLVAKYTPSRLTMAIQRPLLERLRHCQLSSNVKSQTRTSSTESCHKSFASRPIHMK